MENMVITKKSNNWCSPYIIFFTTSLETFNTADITIEVDMPVKKER